MPNSITLNSGTGGQLLTTDQIIEAGTTVHAQYIKILSGAAGATAAIGGDAAQGLDVDVTRVQGSVLVSGVGSFLVTGIVTVQGSVLVSGVGSFLVTGDVGVSADPSATFFVATSVDRSVLVSGVGNFSVIGDVAVSADPSSTFFVATSADRTVLVSAAGTQIVTGIVTVQGTVLISAAGTQLISGIVTVQGNVQVSAAGTQLVSGIVTVQGSVLVSGVGNFRSLPTMGQSGGHPVSANNTTNPLKFVRINASAAGDLVLVASTAGRAIRVIGFTLVATSAMVVSFQDTEATTVPKQLAGPFDLADRGGVAYAGGIFAPAFESTVAAGIELTRAASGAIPIGGFLTYVEITY